MALSRPCHYPSGVAFLFSKWELLLVAHSSFRRNPGSSNWFKNGHTTESHWIFFVFWITTLGSEAKVWAKGKSPKVRRKTTENFDHLATYSFLFFSKHRRETVIFLSSLLSYAWKSCLKNFRRDYAHPKIKTKTKIKKKTLVKS